jgi:polyphosphate kinase 2 (PPK2 family)
MKIKTNEFRLRPGDTVDLQKWPTRVEPLYKSKKKYAKKLNQQVEELSELQHLHYVSDSYAVLLIFQAMDSADKDDRRLSFCPAEFVDGATIGPAGRQASWGNSPR